MTDTTGIVSVWSSYGHTFVTTDAPEHESCLTCGAMYELRATDYDPRSGVYEAADGSTPEYCTYDTDMSHGYPGERVCGACNGTGCEHCEHDCNCLFCNS